MAEIPLLVVDVQRGGPSTGLPTHVEQSDLNLAFHAGHGDAPRVVVAPSNVEDCFYLVLDAVRIAVDYSVPVIFLSDQALATRLEAFPMPELKSLVRQAPNPRTPATVATHRPYPLDAVTSHAPPGTRIEDGNYPNITGLEHDENGHPSASPKMHAAMTTKRRDKLAKLAETLPLPEVHGPGEGDILLVGWGSTEGVIREAVNQSASKGRVLSSLHLRHLNPLPAGLEEIFTRFERVIVVEMNDCDANGCGQLARILRSSLCLRRISGMTKTDGLSFRVSEILERLPETSAAATPG